MKFKYLFLILFVSILFGGNCFAGSKIIDLPLQADLADKKGILADGEIKRVSAATYIDTNGVLQTADGDSTPFSHTSIEDETGATEMRGSFVDSQAWFHDAGGLIAVYADTGNLLKLDDGADGDYAYGFIGEVGTGETFAVGVVDDDCADDDTGDWSVIDCTLAFDTDHYEIIYTANTQNVSRTFASLTPGKLYEMSIDVKDGTAASINSTLNAEVAVGEANHHTSTVATSAEWQTLSLKFVPSAAIIRLRLFTTMVGAGNIEIKNIYLKEVTEPNANAVHIYKEYSLTTEGWNTIGSGIDYNADTDWDFDVCPYNNIYHPICQKSRSKMGMNLR